MAIPASAEKLPQPLDPYDVLEVDIPLSRAADGAKGPHLEGGENVASFAVERTVEATAIGLIVLEDARIGSATYPKPTLHTPTDGGDPFVRVWLAVADVMQSSTIFDGEGQQFALRVNTLSTNVPPRRKQRTVAGTVKNL